MDLLNTKKHIVQCPSCGRDVLDHMTECPFCKGKLEPLGYRPQDTEQLKKVKLTLNIIAGAAAFLLILWLILSR
jgi:hypothetical protein